PWPGPATAADASSTPNATRFTRPLIPRPGGVPLPGGRIRGPARGTAGARAGAAPRSKNGDRGCSPRQHPIGGAERVRTAGLLRARQEIRTSELQSRENLVCRLLLEKKKIWIIATSYDAMAIYFSLHI